jgi:hypothetical protein
MQEKYSLMTEFVLNSNDDVKCLNDFHSYLRTSRVSPDDSLLGLIAL